MVIQVQLVTLQYATVRVDHKHAVDLEVARVPILALATMVAQETNAKQQSLQHVTKTTLVHNVTLLYALVFGTMTHEYARPMADATRRTFVNAALVFPVHNALHQFVSESLRLHQMLAAVEALACCQILANAILDLLASRAMKLDCLLMPVQCQTREIGCMS